MDKQEFKPYVSPDQTKPELTVFSVIAGALLSIVFGAANAYLGLRVGMTVSASIPAAVLSMGVMRALLKRSSILENNTVQTVGSAGESVAAGVIFTLPVLFMWNESGISETPSLLNLTIAVICGALLGVFLMIPLRRSLIVEEHGKLAYPEGTACAQVLMAGEEGGTKSGIVFSGLGIAALYKFIADGLKLFPSELNIEFKRFRGSAFGADILPALLGVGYICGGQISSFVFAGGVLAWLVLMPLIALFGGDRIIYPAVQSVSELYESLGSRGLWSTYIRYIGAGALAAGGIISLIKTLPTIISTFVSAFGSYGKGEKSTLRTDQEFSTVISLLGSIAIGVFLWLYPGIPVNGLGALIILIFGFFFASVSARMVGTLGSSNNPVSGMSIAVLLLATLLLKLTGNTGSAGMISAIMIGAVVCISTCMASDMSQDLKTGFLLGATPKKQQIGELVGALAASFAIGAIMILLNKAWGFGSDELPAPQAMMMKMVVEGVMSGSLPWTLILIGAFIAVAVFLLGLPVLPIAIGIYLPIHLSAVIMAGGIIRTITEKKKYSSENGQAEACDRGILYSSGLIAGEGLVGILLAVFAVISSNGITLSDRIDLSSVISLGSIGGLAAFACLIFSLCFFVFREKK